MAYSSSSSMQDLFYMDNAPVASTSTASTPSTRFTVDYAPRPSPIHHWLAAHRPYLPHDEPSSCSTPRSAFSDDEDECEESEQEQEQEQDESEDESEEEDEREMIFLRPRRHGSASPFARSSSDLVSPRKLRSNPVLPTTATATATAPVKKTKQSTNSPRMIAALASYRPRPAQPIVDRVQASGTSSFEAAPCTSHWSSDEDESEDSERRRPRGRPYRRSTLRPDQDDEALWTVAPNDLALALDDEDEEEEEDEEMPGLCEGSSTRSLPIPISPSPLRHPYFDPSRDDVSIVLSTTSHQQPLSPAHDAKATRQLFQKGQSFYNGWLREYVAAHH